MVLRFATPADIQSWPPAQSDSQPPDLTETNASIQSSVDQIGIDKESAGPEKLSAVGAEGEQQEESELPTLTRTVVALHSWVTTSPTFGYVEPDR